MTWLLDYRWYSSEKNGLISCRRSFGQWEVFVGGYHESSRYMRDAWRDAYGRLPVAFAPRRMLMLGLAAGDNITLLRERWPGCVITAVEWDPVMVRVAYELQLFPRGSWPTVVIADAGQALDTLAGPFDLVLVDIFTGGRIAQATSGDGFFDRLARLVASDGRVLVNGFRDPQAIDSAARSFTQDERWKYVFNHMGLFSRKPLSE